MSHISNELKECSEVIMITYKMSVFAANNQQTTANDILQSWVKKFLLRFKKHSFYMFHCQPRNCTMAQYFSQPFPKPGRNVFTLLWTTLYFQRHVHEAAANGHLKIVRYFHRLGADIEARDTEDRRPLWLAAQVGVTPWIRLPFLEFTWPTKILYCCDAFNS